ncbi:carbohydrate ABC transporter permease [Nonomuraea soli]|uniref:Multiple sugar transport system permease protein n=1 Tax=Nonomuraea soli TaxID=1032476 RepID=A0A7W0HUQ6_9ACTN|nr:sugar ABC transporter permease [Nonomuraea soli]MBA2896350.1 multiple sugar transport system permease protein [Nonomuraea soli]
MAATHAAPPPPSRGRRGEGLKALLWLSPFLVGTSLFFVYPFLATIFFSFHRYDLFTLEYVGLDNWAYVFSDQLVIQSAANTLWLVVFMVPAQLLFALGMAQLLTKVKAGAGILRTIFYLPSLVPLVAGTVAFVFLLNPATGPVNQILGFFGIEGPDWFGSSAWSKPSLTLLGMWGIGNTMMIFLAALLDVPKHLYEAAAIDGASAWRQFRSVTLPMISPVLMFSAITGVIYALQYFTQAMIASRVASGGTDSAGSTFTPGYPDGSLLTLPQHLFHTGFRDWMMGAASVHALLLFAAAMIFTLMLLRQFRKAEES